MRLRAPTPDDLGAAYAVVEARDLADLGVSDYTLQDIRDTWQLSEVDLASDVRLVEDETGRIVGYGFVEDLGAFSAVRPDAEGRGAGSLLLDWTERRESERGHPVHRQYVAATDRTAAAFLSARGYSLARSMHRMIRRLDGSVPSDAPAGVTLRQLEPEDAEAINALDNRAFANDPGYVPASLTAFREEHLEAHDTALDLSLVAGEEERIVGFLVAKRWDDQSTGYVEILAVDPDCQGRGIGRALLLRAFSGFAAAGLREAQLGVSSVNPRTLRLYESAGMTPRFRHDVYERPMHKAQTIDPRSR